MSEVDVINLFNQAWIELYCPPVRLALDGEDKKDTKFSIVNGTVYLKRDIIPRGCDPKEFLLSFFRHELAHAHHCPYDIKTAYSLEKAAYNVVLDWNIAYLSTLIFSDLEVNLNYLLRRFNEFPYLMRAIGIRREYINDVLSFEVYNQIKPTLKPRDRDIAEAANEILTVMQLNRPWHIKVQMIAIILSRLKEKKPNLFSKKKMERMYRERSITVREDLLPGTLKMFEDTLSSISKAEEAKEFFKQWIEPRIAGEEKEKIKKTLKAAVKKIKKTVRKKAERSGEGGGRSRRDTSKDRLNRGAEEPWILGEEPKLPTSLSRPYSKISSRIMDEAFWRRYWYRSRAEKILVKYLSESSNIKPSWSVMKYPDEWYIEDDLEKLDVEMSLDEGPLIPEVTTLKWVEEPASRGQSVISSYAPSAIIVLDVSRSMIKTHEVAGIAAFIAYLSALRSGGETATLSFSTKYIVADWDSPKELKELTLSMEFNEYTIFPAYEVERLASENRGTCFIVIITDGGWQNIDEAISILEKIADKGHNIIIFKLPGGEYPDKINHIKKSPYLKVYKINNPEVDLQNMVLSESVKTYISFLT